MPDYSGSGTTFAAVRLIEANCRCVRSPSRNFALAERHLDSPHRQVCNLATALFRHNERLFTVLDQEGVEPTNNRTERALRTGVQWRKTCFGNRGA